MSRQDKNEEPLLEEGIIFLGIDFFLIEPFLWKGEKSIHQMGQSSLPLPLSPNFEVAQPSLPLSLSLSLSLSISLNFLSVFE